MTQRDPAKILYEARKMTLEIKRRLRYYEQKIALMRYNRELKRKPETDVIEMLVKDDPLLG